MTSSSPARPAGFRADVEGLRALAVLLVIFYHLQVPGVRGGFVGVDVFFVISGFVITQLLERNFAKGSFRFRDFYARRIRRLVPIFLLVSTVTFLAISPYYIGDAYYIFAKSWIASLTGISNLYYFQELSQYFAPAAQSLSLLHTWSLAVEEQFYLIWPLALLLAFRIGKGRSHHWPYVGILLVTFAVSVVMALQWPTAAYYLLPARLFEFLLGTGVALYGRQLPTLGRAQAEAIAWSGLALIIGTGLLLTKHDPFPGYNALWPTLGTALVIYAGLSQPGTSAARLLGLPVMVFLGGLSYSLYLWHWPPIAFMHYQLIELTWANRLGVMAGALLLSWLGFHLVENRFRHRPWGFKRSFLTFVFVPLLFIWAIQSTIRLADDLSFRIPERHRALYKIIVNNDSAHLYKRCFKGDPVDFNQSSACLFGKPSADGKPNAVLIGDSHAIASLGLVQQLIQGSDYYLLLVTQASTAFLPTELAEKFMAGAPDKINRNKALSAYLSQRPMTVFLGAWWRTYLGNPAYQQRFLDTITWLEARGHKVVLIGDVPELPSSDFSGCAMKDRPDCSISATNSTLNRQEFVRFKQAVKQRFPDVRWIEPYKLLCNADRCQTVLNGIPLYRDESHLNYIGSSEIGREYRARFGNPLAGLPGSGLPAPQ